MKKLLTIILMMLLLTSTSFGYVKIYDLVGEEQPISSGVTYKNIKRFTTTGWLNINVLKVDLTNQYVKLDMLTPKDGMYNLDTVMNQAKNAGAVAAVNGEFFTWVGTSLGSPIGFSMKDGEVVSTPAYQNEDKDTLATFSLNKSGVPFYSYVKKVKVEVENKAGETYEIGEINKSSSDFLVPVIYTSDFMKNSFGNTKFFDTVEIVVEDDRVTDIRNCEDPVLIPENGYVITARGDNAYYLKQLFKEGSKIKLNVETDADMSKMILAISGGTILVKDGSVVDSFTHNISGYNPRTALGTSGDNKTLYLVAVDGRGASKGVTQTEMAYLMNELGSDNAINLDGGGSTNMVGRFAGDTTLSTLNTPSENRKVISSVGVISTAPEGKLNSLIITSNRERIFVNHKAELTVKGYDKYINPIEIDSKNIKWEVKGVKGSVENNVFTPTTSGKAKLTATYKGVSETFEMDVLGDVGTIELAKRTVELIVGGTYTLKPVARDVYGFTAPYDISNYTFTTSNNNCSVDENGVIKGLESGETLVTVRTGNTKSFIGVKVKGDNLELVDDFEDDTTTYFSSYPKDLVEGEVELSTKEKYSGKKSLKLSYDFTETTGARGAYIRFYEEPELDEDTNYIDFYVYSKKNQPDVAVKLQILDADDVERLVVVSDSIKADWQEMKYDLSDIKLPGKLQRIYVAQAKDEGNDTYVYVDKLSFSKSISSGATKITIPANIKPEDICNREEEKKENGISFAVYKNISNNGTLYNKLIKNRLKTITENVDFMIVKSGSLGGVDNLKTLSNNSSFVVNGTKFIMLNNEKSSLSTSQWTWFIEEIEKTKENNIVLVLSKPIESALSDSQEQTMFMDILANLKDGGKNVTTLYFGIATGYKMYNGYKEFGVDITDYNNVKEKVENDKYIKFVVNGNDVTYQVLPIYE
ncbi:MAG: phosphodiester glycosidase family protein [Clostridia bacterium]|nr:phosphodiester glycosidase family protein [Clostridia bacterium]